MTYNYFKLAFRNLIRNKVFSSINISGLAIGIASFVIIMLYVRYEMSYDKFFDNSENICRVYMDYLEGDTYVPADAQSYNLSGPTLKNEFPEIKEFVRLLQLNKSTFTYNNNIIEVTNGHLADNSYFTVFNYPLIKGDASTALINPNSIVLTEKTAHRIFGDKDPMGENLSVFHSQEKTNLTVTGIIKDIPENTHLKTNFLVSFNTNKTWDVCRSDLNWSNNGFFTYLLIDAKADKALLKDKITARTDLVEDERHNIEALTNIHLHSHKPFEAEANGYANRIFFLLAIAIIIIVLSWLNYINLSTTQSLERAKETGIRKVSGANKKQLIFQFLSESVLINIVAVLIAFCLVLLLLPVFNMFTGKNFQPDLNIGNSMLMLIGVILTGAVFSGLYPALVLSNFQPVKILKGKVYSSNSTINLRKGMVIIQFLATIILLIGTLTINKQIRFLQNQPLGINTNQIISIKGDILEEKNNFENKFKIIKAELKKKPFVKSVASSDTYPGQGDYYLSSSMGLRCPDGRVDGQTVWYNYRVDHDYIPLLGIELLSGQNFLESSQSFKQLIINETAAKKMGIDNYDKAINSSLNFQGEDWNIIGIMKDYHHSGLNDMIEPMILKYTDISYEGLLIQLNDNITSMAEIEIAIKEIKQEWETVFPQSTFNYSFVDDEFEAQYLEDKKFNKAFSVFTLLAIFIASLGLFGLAYYTCTKRIKEIGVRKVNGANELEILGLLNKDYVIWISIAFIIGTPLAKFVMQKWLNNFAYHTELSWWIFALAGVFALGIALLTVSWQSWRAAVRNPVEALRYE